VASFNGFIHFKTKSDLRLFVLIGFGPGGDGFIGFAIFGFALFAAGGY